MMKKFLLLYILLFQNILFGCATCMIMSPTAQINLKLDIQDKHLQKVHIQWFFSKIYTSELSIQYDKNTNGILDKKELDIVKKAMLDYLIPKDMLTSIKYANFEDENFLKIKAKYKNFNVKVQDKHLIFTYEAQVNQALNDNSTLSFAFEDDEGYFGFVVENLEIDKNEINHTQNLYLFTASIIFTHDSMIEKVQENNVSKNEFIEQVAVEKNTKVVQEEKVIVQEESLQENILKQSIVKIKSLFESIKDEKNPLTYMMLLLFAYIYGVIHALGPGHGKTLVASYFLSNERSYSKAFFVSLAIGIVHTFSAFLLTLVIYFLVNSFLSQFLNDTVFYTTKISALIIISIAVYLLYTKYKAYKELQRLQNLPKFSFSATPHVATCSCASCKVDNNSTDMALIVSAGIIPCPGTITIFIFSLSLGLYYAGFLSALVMSLGMSTIIFLSAILSVTIRKKTLDSNSNLKKYLEYGSLTIVLLLGLILLFT